MNTEEKNNKLQDIADNCVTTGDVLEKVQKLNASEKYALVYRIGCDEFFSETRKYAIDLSYLFDELGLVNDYEKGISKQAPTLGTLNLAIGMLKQVYEKQARTEMQCVSQETEWGMTLADAISDKANQVFADVEDLTKLMCHYEAVLLGRRMGVHFMDEEGRHVPKETNKGED